MKKEKLFEVGVINESTIDVVKDMTTFYTSDTELWLGFELSEEGVKFDSAEILMFNIDDKSFVVRSVVKADDKYWYELDMDMIAHPGEWKAQLQFTKNNEVYTSKHFDFRIENDLSNERPPKLIDITNWSNIKQTADSLIAEMKVAVTEAIAAEQNRADIFSQAESERQTTFETNESKRDEIFEINELTRQTQELEREKAEAKRQTEFNDNEASRTETFNTNEATRQENEEARELAENERENAEAQRKIEHANRSAELASKADKVQEGWIIPTLLNGWEAQSTDQKPRYFKDEFGIVHLEGCVKSGLNGSDLFVLPTGYKAFVTQRYAASNSDTTVGRVDVRAGGAVAPHKGSSVYVYLSGISFRAGG